MNETPQSPPAIPVKKGLPAIAWVGIGCGSFVVIALIVVSLAAAWLKRTVNLDEFKRNPAKAGAELAVKLNPDLEMVSQDEAKGEMTIRTKDGKEMTLNYEDVANGKFTMKDSDGNVTRIGKSDLSEVPSWVPRPPQSKEAAGSYHNSEADHASGLFVTTSPDSLDSLEAFFQAEALKHNFSKSAQSTSGSGKGETRSLTYEAEGRKLNVNMVAMEPGEVQVSVFYSDKK
jgi:hypothetical protein